MERIGKFEALTRTGFAARGLVYGIIGVLTLLTGHAAGQAEALRVLQETALSGILLLLLGGGLACYGVWRLTESAVDLEGHGHGPKGIGIRVGHLISGLTHLALAAFAFTLPFSEGSGASNSAQTLASFLLSLPAGTLLVYGLAVAFVLAGLGQLRQAYHIPFLHQLAEAASRWWVRWIGRVGYVARAVVFTLVGIFFFQAASAKSPEEAGGMAEALQALPVWALSLVAAGLFLFGVFSLVQAAFRRITSEDVRRRLGGTSSA